MEGWCGQGFVAGGEGGEGCRYDMGWGSGNLEG